MRTVFYTVILFFLAGVLWRSFFAPSVPEVVSLALLACTVALTVVLLRGRVGAVIVLAALACVLGVARTEFAYRAFADGMVFEERALLDAIGVVVQEPDERDTYTVLTVDIAREDGGETRIRAKVPRHPSFAYGESVRVKGTLHVPTAFETDTGRTFNYRGFLMKDGVHYELRRASAERTGLPQETGIIGMLLAAKHAWLDAVSRIIPEPGASLLGGMIVGAKQSLGETWLDMFRETGIIHIVVLSGYNLTIVAVFIVWLTSRFPTRVRLLLGVAGIVLFALMVGAGATVVRASLMAILALLAVFLGRPYALTRALAAAAFCMVLAQPLILAFDTGFQLSFLATVGLIFGAPALERLLGGVPAAFGIRSILAATFATQLAVLPLLMYSMGTVSLIAPLVNVAVLPLVPVLMAIGFAAGVVALVSQALAMPLAWLTHHVLEYVLWVVERCSQIPLASVEIPPVPLSVVACMYGTLALVVYALRTKSGTDENAPVPLAERAAN